MVTNIPAYTATAREAGSVLSNIAQLDSGEQTLISREIDGLRLQISQEIVSSLQIIHFRVEEAVGSKEIAAMSLTAIPGSKGMKNFNISHRFVDPNYCQQGIGTSLLNTSLAFCDEYNKHEASQVNVLIRVFQKSVLTWLLERGFVAADLFSRDRLENVSINPDYCVMRDDVMYLKPNSYQVITVTLTYPFSPNIPFTQVRKGFDMHANLIRERY